MKLSKKNMLLLSFTLFSLFFGAGNLIFPPLLGSQSGNNVVWALIGFLITDFWAVMSILSIVYLIMLPLGIRYFLKEKKRYENK